MPLMPREDFCALCHEVMEGAATPEEVARFNRLVEIDPACLEVYWRQMQTDLLLTCCCGGGLEAAPGRAGSVDAAVNSGHRTGRRRAARFVKIAAAAAALALAAAGLWLAAGDGRQATGDRRGSGEVKPNVAGRQSPVEILHHWGSCGLEVPESLPGTMRMTSGRIKARLAPGVELILLGPFELEVKGPKDARLLSGRLVADIPAKDGGFTLRTPDLEMWDYGAVFCASAADEGSDIFVFAGEAQVVEASGEPVDICRAGEGARARRDGSGAVKVAAEVWPYAAKMLARIEDTGAAENPEYALYAASRVSHEWAKLRMPEEAWRIRERLAMAEPARRAPEKKLFSMKAWVGSTPVVQPIKTLRQPAEALARDRVSVHLPEGFDALSLKDLNLSGDTCLPILVETSPVHNRHWSTLFTNEVALRWEWPACGVRAFLTIEGMNGGLSTNFTREISEWVWRVFDAAVPKCEDVYALTLAFEDEHRQTLGTLTHRAAVMPTAFGIGTVDFSVDARRWSQISETCVLPYDGTWAEASCRASSAELVIAKQGGKYQSIDFADASGYYGWMVRGSNWGYGVFDLTLAFADCDGMWRAALRRFGRGTMIGLR